MVGKYMSSLATVNAVDCIPIWMEFAAVGNICLFICCKIMHPLSVS